MSLGEPPSMPLKMVEWRADSEPATKNGKTVCRWVPHLTAAGCARLLDEWAGPTGWRVKYMPWELEGKTGLMCQIDVYDHDIGEWVTKVDAGDIMRGEHQIKGSISDAFKRTAGRAWGCGRNVYETPTLWAPCGSYRAKSGKMVATLVAETKPALVAQLQRLGFTDAGDIALDMDEHTPEESFAAAPAETPETSISTGTVSVVGGVIDEKFLPPLKKPAPAETATTGYMSRILGRDPKEVKAIRDALKDAGVPWPVPADLPAEVAEVVEQILATF